MKKHFRTAFLFLFALAQVCIAAPGDLSKPLTTVKEVGAIPLDDSSDDKEVKDFQKNWKGKTISITGKVNKGGGISLDEYYVNGCSAVLKREKLGSVVTVTGTLVSRSRGGSGGEPIDLTNCRLSGEGVAAVKAQAATVASIPPQFHGFWDIKQQSCKKLEDTETAITIKSNETYQLELGCKLKAIDKLTEQSVTVNMLCENEGGKIKRVYTFNLLPDGRLVVGKNTLTRCK